MLLGVLAVSKWEVAWSPQVGRRHFCRRRCLLPPACPQHSCCCAERHLINPKSAVSQPPAKRPKTSGSSTGGNSSTGDASDTWDPAHLQKETQQEQPQEQEQQQEQQEQPHQRGTAGKPKPVTPEILQRCAGTLGSWCVEYWTQPEVPARTAPRGNKQCSLDCNQVRWAGACGLGNTMYAVCCDGIV